MCQLTHRTREHARSHILIFIAWLMMFGFQTKKGRPSGRPFVCLRFTPR